jgi:hypothetical protein
MGSASSLAHTTRLFAPGMLRRVGKSQVPLRVTESRSRLLGSHLMGRASPPAHTIASAEMGEEVTGPFEGQIESLGCQGVCPAETSNQSLQGMAKFRRCHFHSDGWMKGEVGNGSCFGCL